jgi:hypothetical protein
MIVSWVSYGVGHCGYDLHFPWSLFTFRGCPKPKYKSFHRRSFLRYRTMHISYTSRFSPSPNSQIHVSLNGDRKKNPTKFYVFSRRLQIVILRADRILDRFDLREFLTTFLCVHIYNVQLFL